MRTGCKLVDVEGIIKQTVHSLANDFAIVNHIGLSWPSAVGDEAEI